MFARAAQVCSTCKGLAESLGALHATLTALRPGDALMLIEPLLKPLNRLELQVRGEANAIFWELTISTVCEYVLE